MTHTRIYVVTPRGAAQGPQRLVRATSQAAARNHVARETLGVQRAAQETLVELLSDGVKVEDAGAEPQEAEA